MKKTKVKQPKNNRKDLFNSVSNSLDLSRFKFFTWQYFFIYYLLLRVTLNVSYLLIYSTLILMILARISFERIAMFFFLIALVVYISGQDVEANHYFSFVYAFIALSLLKYIYFFFKERFQKA